MYVPYAAVYYVDRVHLMCSINAACHHLTMSDYLTTEIVLMAVGVLLHCPLWFFVLLLLDIKKSGGNISDFFKHFLVRTIICFVHRLIIHVRVRTNVNIFFFFSMYANRRETVALSARR